MRISKNNFKLAKRKCVNAAEVIKRDKFMEACISGDKNMFQELKKMRNKGSNCSSKIDSKTSPEDIADHFSDIYKELFNRTGTSQPLKDLFKEVNENINDAEYETLNKVDSKLVHKIINNKLKNDKADPEFDVTTDALKTSPFELSEHLSLLIKAFLIHGYLPYVLLLCAITPLVKDMNGKLEDSSNYRGIGIGSLFLKIIDWVILIVNEAELASDQNQFGFQRGASTSMCTWTAIEVIDYFKRSGSSIYACLLDYRKAFDLVNHEKLFRILIDRKVGLIFIRILIFIYLNQKCYIKWQNTRSYSFFVTNGTRQGSVFSPMGGFGCYLDPLLKELRESGLGCRIGNHWYGALAYADDVILLSTSVQGLQNMVSICETHANRNDLQFSSDPDPTKSKTICIAFNESNKKKLANIMLNGDKLPWKEFSKHIGNYLHENGTMNKDISIKRAQFIQNCMNQNDEFECLPIESQEKLLSIYNSHFTGSNLWDLSSESTNQVFGSWNRNLKIVKKLPLETHKYLIEGISEYPHIKKRIFERYLTFIKSLVESKKPIVSSLFKLISKDIRSVPSSNLRTIYEQTGIFINPGITQKGSLRNYNAYKVPTGEDWKIGLLTSLLEIREGQWSISFDEENGLTCFPDEEINRMIKDICTS